MNYITKGYIVGLHHPLKKRLKFCGHRETRSLWMQYAVGRWKNDNQHHRNPNSFHSFVPSVESCDFDCDNINSMEAQIHELMHIIDFRLVDIFNASIRNL